MASGAKIPGGSNKGTPIESAEQSDIEFWLKRRKTDLETDPNGEFAANNKRWVAAAEAELKRRAAGGQQAARPAAPETPPPPKRVTIPPGVELPAALLDWLRREDLVITAGPMTDGNWSVRLAERIPPLRHTATHRDPQEALKQAWLGIVRARAQYAQESAVKQEV